MEKTCTKCKEVKSIEHFYRNKILKDGRENKCKPCQQIYIKAYYEKNKAKLIEYRVNYNKSNPRKQYRDLGSRFKVILNSAKNRKKYPVSITIADIASVWDLQKGLCVYTKLPMSAASNQLYTVSLDRIDSSKGYEIGNIQLICSSVNRMKQEFTQDVFLTLCNLVTQNNTAPDYPTELARIP